MFFSSPINRFNKKINDLYTRNNRNQKTLFQRLEYEAAEFITDNKLLRTYYSIRIQQLNNSFYQFNDHKHDLHTCTLALTCLHNLFALKHNQTLMSILNEEQYRLLLNHSLDHKNPETSAHLSSIMQALFSDHRIKQLVHQEYSSTSKIANYYRLNQGANGAQADYVGDLSGSVLH